MYQLWQLFLETLRLQLERCQSLVMQQSLYTVCCLNQHTVSGNTLTPQKDFLAIPVEQPLGLIKQLLKP